MLAALICNQPYTLPSGGYEEIRRRRPNERFTTDDEIRAQDELTAFKAKPEAEQKVIVAKAIETVKAAPETEISADAQDIISELRTIDAIMSQLDALTVVIMAHFRLQSRRRRDIAAMLLLGIL